MDTSRQFYRLGLCSALFALNCASPCAFSQPATTQAADESSLIALNFPENVELKTLVDYVSQRMGFNVIYQDELLANQKVTIKSPVKVPASALIGLLQNLLKMKGFALVDAEQPGFKRIVSLQASAVAATQPSAPVASAGEQVVTQVFPLQSIDAVRAEAAVKPFLSGPTAGSLGIPEQHLLLVTDFASNLKRVGQILELVDQPNRNLRIEFLPVKNADASQLALQIKQILTARSRAQALPGQSAESSFDVTQDRRTGQLVLIAPAALVDEARSIIKALDAPVTEQQSPIRFYKLANATAVDVLETIRALEGEGTSAADQKPVSAPSSPANPTPANPSSPALPGTVQGNSTGGLPGGSSGVGGLPGGQTNPTPGSSYGNWQTGASQSGIGIPGGVGTSQTTATTPPPVGLRTKNANVAADPNTNTIIVMAEPTVQKMYEQLIRTLDKRRPQVLIEATVVSINTTNGYTFGVELAGNSKPGKTSVVTFSSFGFSTPNPLTGALALTPGVGFNGAVIGSDVAEIILRALHTSSRAKVTSSPRILVNDNATGSLTSLDGEPFTTTAIGNTISTTSFGGYAQAGTTVTLTPHISEADYLQLEYQVSLSSFTTPGDPARGIPPGIQQDAVQSKVTIPDGSTVVVGGLNRTNVSRAVQSVPFLDQIPILKYLASRHDDTDQQSTLFVFLRPIILRDDQFEDLKFLSERDLKVAGLPAGMPASEPLPIR